MLVTSLAGSGVQYVSIQARWKPESKRLHVQGEGSCINRTYGCAMDLAFDSGQESVAFVAWLNTQVPTLGTLAHNNGTPGTIYHRFQVRKYGGGKLHFQVMGAPGNRKYGYAFTSVGHEPGVDALRAFICQAA